VIEWAKDARVDLLELTVWDFDLGARAFFESLGFEPLWRRQALKVPA
jgi:hypothetical protein